MRNDVAALYVDPRGPYPRIVAEWYDEARDARTYAGPWPVVAHPPCGPWGMLRAKCKLQDAGAGPHAVSIVRRFGGVLEHPVGSLLFRHCGMPFDGELPDAWGGRTYRVDQCAWGHACRKPTLLYVVGVPAGDVVRGIRTGGTPTHWVWGSHSSKTPIPPGMRACSAQIRRRSPPAFAEWLVSLAAIATHRRAAS